MSDYCEKKLWVRNLTGGGEREVKSRSGDRGGSAGSSLTVLNGWFYLWDAVPLPASQPAPREHGLQSYVIMLYSHGK